MSEYLWRQLDAEATNGDPDNRCLCGEWLPPHRDLCLSCEDEDTRTFGGDAA